MKSAVLFAAAAAGFVAVPPEPRRVRAVFVGDGEIPYTNDVNEMNDGRVLPMLEAVVKRAPNK